MNTHDHDEMERFARRYRSYMEWFIYSDLEVYSPKKAGSIRLEIGMDEAVYTDHSKIHLGMKRLDGSSDMLGDALYLLGHELQHLHSTRQRDWLAGQTICLTQLCRYFSQEILGREIVPRRQKDVDVLCRKLQDKGYYLTPRSLGKIIHFILNSVEDGRIEAIRNTRHPGFTKYMVTYRRDEWEKTEETSSPDADDLTPSNELRIVMNQILTLATMQVWQKGFTSRFIASKAGTNMPVYDRCTSLIPHIRDAITAPTCRDCMQAGCKIVMSLRDLILEAAKEDGAIAQMLEKLIEAIQNGDYSFGNHEQKGNGAAPAPFGKSVVIFTDQELPEGEQSSGGGESGVIVSTKKPSEPASEEGGTDSSSSGATSTPGEGEPDDSSGENTSPSSTAGESGPDDMSFDQSVSEAAGEAAGEAAAQKAAVRGYAEASAAESDRFSNRPQSEPQPSTLTPDDLREVNAHYAKDVRLSEDVRDYPLNHPLPYALTARGSTLKQTLLRELQRRKAPNRRGQRSGTIDPRRLHRLPMRELDFFSRSGKSDKPSVAAYFLIDNSGSMCGEKRRFAAEAAAVCEEGFQELCALKLVAFDAAASYSVHHQIIKNWDETDVGNHAYNWLVCKTDGLGNKDGYSIRTATRDLLARGERDKLLVVLSDGVPTEYDKGVSEGVEDVIAAVSEARAAGLCVIGIFISEGDDEDTFRSMYGEQQSVITSPEGIEDALVAVLRKFFFH